MAAEVSEDLEIYLLDSHRRALAAIKEGRFDREIVPLNGLPNDETPRASTLEQMATLDPIFGLKKVCAPTIR